MSLLTTLGTGWSWAGAMVGAMIGLGLALVVVGLPVSRRPGLNERLEPYLRDTPRPSRLLMRPDSVSVAVGDEVVGSRLLAKQVSHPLDDPVADGVAERIVVPLEAGDIDEADRTPASALLERQERLELLGEPAEVHQLRLRVLMRLVGQVLD